MNPDTFAAPVADADAPINLIGMDREDMAAELASMGEPKFRADQLFKWVYGRGVTDFEEMTNISKPLRARLAERFVVARPGIARDLASTDGTHKWLLNLGDGNEVECVHIPESDRGTLCVSSQVGCTLNCRFSPHRHPASRAQSGPDRDCRPDHAGPRPPERMADP